MVYPQLHELYTPIIWNQIGRLLIIELEFLLLLLSNVLYTQSASIIFIIHQDSHFVFLPPYIFAISGALHLCSFLYSKMFVSISGSRTELAVYNSSEFLSALVAQSHSRNTGLFCISFCICTIEKGFSWRKWGRDTMHRFKKVRGKRGEVMFKYSIKSLLW